MHESKACKKCKQTFIISNFPKCSDCKDGHTSICKKCTYKKAKEKRDKQAERQRYKEYREKNLEKERQRVRSYRKANPEKAYQSSLNWKMNNPEAQTKWLQTRLQNLQGNVYKVRYSYIKKLKQSACFYCNSKNHIEIDHIVPVSRGGRHSEGNLTSACRSCNRSKGSLFLTEWKKTNP